jgi:hypothetical protein
VWNSLVWYVRTVLFVGDFSELQEWSRFLPRLCCTGMAGVFFVFPFCLTRTAALANSECCEETMTHVVCQAAPLAYLILFHFQFLLNHVTCVSYNWWAAFMVIGRDTPGPQPQSYEDGYISKCWWEFNVLSDHKLYLKVAAHHPMHTPCLTDFALDFVFFAAPPLLVTRYEHQILFALSLSLSLS